jgi:hypothetical protein
MKTIATPASESLLVDLKKYNQNFSRVRVPDGTDIGLGNFNLNVDITAVKEDIYIPVSIASGKKPTGFVYQIEGTKPGSIKTADISCKGEGVTQITLGTIVYAKIPRGLTATFRIRIQIQGKIMASYRVVIREIRFKFDPSDARYKVSPVEINADMIRFL